MARIKWDDTGEKLYETGTDRGVLYVYDKATQQYGNGVGWNGLTAVNENPEGADTTDLYANNAKYLSMIAAETFGFTIEAYTYPAEFGVCDGSAELAPGVYIGQQSRISFCFTYRTLIGNDTQDTDYGYKVHICYGCKASPSSKDYQTVNESPEAISFSWEVSTTPVPVANHKPTACIIIDSTAVAATALANIENALYGTDATEGEEASSGTAARILMPSDILTMINAAG